MADTETSRRLYGRGYHDGLRAAAAERREVMNSSKLANAERSLSTTAKKVLEAVPIAEPWNTGRIAAELKRLGINMDFAIVEGCLDNLRGHGLVREPSRGSFIRVQARPALSAVIAESPTEQAAPAETPASTPLDQMAELAQAARDLASKASRLAEQIEAAALDVEERMQRIASDTAKLKQLQQLLRSIEQA